MTSRVSDAARWVATPLSAVGGALGAQIVVFQLLGLLLCRAFGLPPQGATIWATKTITSVFMGAAFVSLVWLLAPQRKVQATVVALGVVILWGGTLIVAAFEHRFHGWLFAMGLAGIVGGGVAFWLGRRAVALPGAAQQ